MNLPPEVGTYFEDKEKHKHNTEFEELKYSKGSRNYDRILKRLRAVNLPSPEQLLQEKLPLSEITNIITDIMSKVLGEEFRSQIEGFSSLLSPTHEITDPFDAILEEEYINGSCHPTKIHVSKKTYSIQILSISHEYVHAFLSPYITTNYNSILTSYHYKELLSILMEYIICYELKEEMKKDLSKEHEVIRLDHDQKQAEENFSCEELRRARICNSYLNYYIEYATHNAFGYIVSDIYSTRLLEYYCDDSKKMREYLAGIIKGTNSIKRLLSTYHVSLSDSQTVQSFTHKLEKYR